MFVGHAIGLEQPFKSCLVQAAFTDGIVFPHSTALQNLSTLSQVSVVAKFASLVPGLPLQDVGDPLSLSLQVSAAVQVLDGQALVPETTAVPLSQVAVVQVSAAQLGSQALVPCCNKASMPLSQVLVVQVLAAQLGSQFTLPGTQARLLWQVLVVQVLSAQ